MSTIGGTHRVPPISLLEQKVWGYFDLTPCLPVDTLCQGSLRKSGRSDSPNPTDIYSCNRATDQDRPRGETDLELTSFLFLGTP